MRIMVHACPKRMWYVEGYLVPKLVEQGIPKKSIVVWNDEAGKGNLISCMEAFKWCGEHPVKGGTWHLQDDVIPAVDFVKRAKKIKDGVVCGICPKNMRNARKNRGPEVRAQGGKALPADMWWSFPCIRIPDDAAGGCAEWFWKLAVKNEAYKGRIASGMYDDWFFREYLRTQRPADPVTLMVPNLANHIAELLGGSTLTPGTRWRAASFEDQGEWNEVSEWMKARNNGI